MLLLRRLTKRKKNTENVNAVYWLYKIYLSCCCSSTRFRWCIDWKEEFSFISLHIYVEIKISVPNGKMRFILQNVLVRCWIRFCRFDTLIIKLYFVKFSLLLSVSGYKIDTGKNKRKDNTYISNKLRIQMHMYPICVHLISNNQTSCNTFRFLRLTRGMVRY